jgi:hippurate hydrolase
MNTQLLEKVSSNQIQMEQWRHHLHQHPELAFEERETSAYVESILESLGYEVTTGLGKTGIVASMSTGSGNKVIGLRSDLDALPVTEEVESSFKSLTDGKMHACGHDGHMAMLLGAAKYLAETKNFNGTVRFLFTPAEEAIAGVPAMMNDGLLDKFPMDAIFGMHNLPTLEQGKIYFRVGPTMAAVDNWEIELTGKGSHGSMPEKSIDPVVAGASLVMALQTIVSRNVAPMQSAVVTIGAFIAGSVGNVIPQSAILRLSIRTTDDATRELVLERIRKITATQAESYGVTFELREGQPGAVLNNDEEQTEFAAEVAKKVFGKDKVSMEAPKLMGSEDFAFFAQEKPCCFCFIGNGDTPMVHHPEYQFDDRNLSIGAAYWVALAEEFLK